jgi:hypothetical protein
VFKMIGICVLFFHFDKHWSLFLQALYASTSISTGMKGATKAMVAMNKVCARGCDGNHLLLSTALKFPNPT